MHAYSLARRSLIHLHLIATRVLSTQHETCLYIDKGDATVTVAVNSGMVCGAAGVDACRIASTPVQTDELVCSPGFQTKLSVELSDVEEGLRRHPVSDACLLSAGTDARQHGIVE